MFRTQSKIDIYLVLTPVEFSVASNCDNISMLVRRIDKTEVSVSSLVPLYSKLGLALALAPATLFRE